MFMAAEEFPLPYEYRFFNLDGLVTVMPDDVDSRTTVFLDCGNIDRNPAHELKRPGAHILNVDHHHDNTRFGSVNWVDADASCTAEMVWDLMRDLGVEPTPTIAEALYVGLVTDTGKFMYENTGTRAHVMAAELIDAGVDVHEIYRRLYEGIPYGKLELLARGLGQVERHDDGTPHAQLLTARRLRGDRRRGELLRGRHRPSALGGGHGGRRAGPRPSQPRQHGPAKGLAARLRRPRRRLARSPAPRAAAAIARRRASHHPSVVELVQFLRGAVRDQLQQPSDGVLRIDKPAGVDLARRGGRVSRRALGVPPRRSRGHARPVRHRAAAGARGRRRRGSSAS